VVAEIESFSLGEMDRSFLTTVDFPTPDGPEITTSRPRRPFIFFGINEALLYQMSLTLARGIDSILLILRG
jgi:hypothetical protein